MSIKDNLDKIKNEVPSNIQIVAATKTRTVEEIKEAISEGIKIIGENYVQEAQKKYRELKGQVKFHCIGHLQKNKVKIALDIFDMIGTLDSLQLAQEIDKRSKKPMPALIEVNIAKEKNKTGVSPENVTELIKSIANLDNIKIQGLMTMAPYLPTIEEYQPYFRTMKELFEDIKKENIPNVEMKYLSMGMSESYHIAIQEGANIIRLGGAIFGQRNK